MKLIDINKHYKQWQLGYFAGIIDGEGCISVSDLSKKFGRSFFSCSVSLSSTDEVLIDWIIDIFGGWKGKYTPRQTPLNSRKKIYRWQITGKNLETVLFLIKPYLVIKKQEAEVMLKIRSTFGITKGGCEIPNKIHRLRTQLALELGNLHCRNYKKH